MTEDLCEVRFDVPLTSGEDRDFERAWRAELAAQKMTALAMPPGGPVRARFRVCGPQDTPEMAGYLCRRLAALPGGPEVSAEPSAPSSDWSGVRIWLSYPAQALAGLLCRRPGTKKRPGAFRARRH